MLTRRGSEESEAAPEMTSPITSPAFRESTQSLCCSHQLGWLHRKAAACALTEP